jgi:hypothetical protein
MREAVDENYALHIYTERIDLLFDYILMVLRQDHEFFAHL